jgi:GTP-binding protein
MTRYVEKRASLAGLIIVMDARRPLTDFDWEMLTWAREQALRAHLLLAKSDKLNKSESMLTLKSVKAKATGYATAQMFSSVTKAGVEEARGCVLDMLGGAPVTQSA